MPRFRMRNALGLVSALLVVALGFVTVPHPTNTVVSGAVEGGATTNGEDVPLAENDPSDKAFCHQQLDCTPPALFALAPELSETRAAIASRLHFTALIIRGLSDTIDPPPPRMDSFLKSTDRRTTET